MKSKEIIFTSKKAFSLLETVISITILMILMVFFYKTLDNTNLTNSIFKEHLDKRQKFNHIYKLILEDIAESKADIRIQTNKNKNAIIFFKSNNTYHNSNYSNITYLISNSKSLMRIESLESFEKTKLDMNFFEKSYIDELILEVQKFVVLKKEDKYVFIIKTQKKEEIIFSTFKID